MIQVVVPEITERLRYTLDFIFRSRGVEFDIQLSNENDSGKILYYGTEHKEAIAASDMLFREDVEQVDVESAEYRGQPCLKINDVVDPIATIFFILTRYEEYDSEHLDEHGRFPYDQSCLSSFNWIEKAVSDRLANAICEQLAISLHHDEVNIVPTFDIDNVYAYKLKTGFRSTASVFRDVLKGNKDRIEERKAVKSGGRDPYDTYDIILKAVSGNNKARVFWLVGDWAEKDRNVTVDNREHADLIRRIGEKVTIGIHPSYKSFQNTELVKKEIKRLANVLGKDIIHSRQHYLRFQLPNSYRTLIAAGIREDYSMGFAQHYGFRAGTARSFNWFDLENNETTSLIIHPFVYMDGTLNEYLQLDPQKAINVIDALYKEVCQYGGDFIFIWHNETIGGYKHWAGWQGVFEHTLTLKNE